MYFGLSGKIGQMKKTKVEKKIKVEKRQKVQEKKITAV